MAHRPRPLSLSEPAPPFAVVRVPIPCDDLPVAALGLDDLETGVLAILHHLCASFVEPGGQAWRRALAIAAERWQPGEGCLILRDLLPVLDALAGVRRETFRTMDPLSLTCRALATPDEAALMRLLAAMRREIWAEVAELGLTG